LRIDTGRITIKDLPEDMKISEETMNAIRGGLMSRLPKRRSEGHGDDGPGGWGLSDVWNAFSSLPKATINIATWPAAKLHELTED
jgi:hypothetical protein